MTVVSRQTLTFSKVKSLHICWIKNKQFVPQEINAAVQSRPHFLFVENKNKETLNKLKWWTPSEEN